MTELKKGNKVPTVRMREQDPIERAHNFNEVPFGYTPEDAQLEASRCLQCKKPKCVEGCPVGVQIPEFIGLIREGKFDEAARKIKETNGLPAVCGRVCPQEDQCEKRCVLGLKSDPVNIGALERFAADWEREHGTLKIPELPPKKGKRIAIVGSGPGGLTCAGDLVKMGYDVTLFEALHKTGGVLVYGIPEFRLPKAIVQSEVDYLEKLGVEVRPNVIIGRTVTIDELFEQGYGAVYVGTGAGLPLFMHIPGENLNGVLSANEYLTRSNLMKAYKFPETDTPIFVGRKTVVLGGGNVAMDSARSALRLGSEEVRILYRRSRKEMPAREDEIHHAEEEGIIMDFLVSPVKILGNGDGWVSGVECIRFELGEPDASGRRRPIPVEGSEFQMECDCVIVAIGNGPNPLVPQTTPGLETTKWGLIVADEETGKTSKKGVFAGGDIVTGAATVILAMGAGRKAATAIDQYLASDGEW
jgi:glutamate synthase (NADPH/NADH) small chain